MAWFLKKCMFDFTFGCVVHLIGEFDSFHSQGMMH